MSKIPLTDQHLAFNAWNNELAKARAKFPDEAKAKIRAVDRMLRMGYRFDERTNAWGRK